MKRFLLQVMPPILSAIETAATRADRTLMCRRERFGLKED